MIVRLLRITPVRDVSTTRPFTWLSTGSPSPSGVPVNEGRLLSAYTPAMSDKPSEARLNRLMELTVVAEPFDAALTYPLSSRQALLKC